MIKMIVTDLDGTLLDSNKNCAKENIEYLKSIKNDYKIVIATGRILDSAIAATEGALFADYIITDAGALIYDMNKKRKIFKKTMNTDIVKKLCSYFDPNKIDFMDICNTKNYNKYTAGTSDFRSHSKKIDDITEFLEKTEDILHITFFFHKDKYVDEFIEKLTPQFPNLDFQVMQDSYRPARWIEVATKGITKYTAIQKIAEIENIENTDIIAFGDSFNDIEMIKNCGIGVAVENAIPLLKEVADHITLSNDENGVMHFLKKHAKTV